MLITTLTSAYLDWLDFWSESDEDEPMWKDTVLLLNHRRLERGIPSIFG